MKMRFSRKLHMAFAAMLAITLSLAWYFYDSVQWFEYDVERIALTNSVLNGHIALATRTRQQIRLIEESASVGAVEDLQKWQENERALHGTIAQIRQAYTDGNRLRNTELDFVNQEVINELEGLVESIIASGERIRLALQSSDLRGAQAEAEILRSEGSIELFNELMEETLAANVEEVDVANREAIYLSHYITSVLPLFMLALAGLTLLVVWLFSRSLTRSVNVLHDGVTAFAGGDLAHHIPELREKEFDSLGKAFNTLALELAEHRTTMHDSQVQLEAAVGERTRALKKSNEKLGMADENRRQLLADISHEFRTPLTVIRGEAEIALRGRVKTRAEYIETLGRVMEQSDQATRLVDDLLFIARADAGEPRLKIRPVSMDGLLSPVCVDFTAKAAQREIRIEQTRIAKNVMVQGDPGRLRQVFFILMDNALRYSRVGGVVRVELKRAKEKVIITITDNGIGLNEDEAKHAFQRFFRGGRAQGHAQGTGLGLPVARAIIEAHHGKITLKGEPGKGAVATVVLPAEQTLKAVA